MGRKSRQTEYVLLVGGEYLQWTTERLWRAVYAAESIAQATKSEVVIETVRGKKVVHRQPVPPPEAKNICTILLKLLEADKSSTRSEKQVKLRSMMDEEFMKMKRNAIFINEKDRLRERP